MKKGHAILLIILAFGLGWVVGAHILSSRAITILNIVIWSSLIIRVWKE